MHLKAITAKGDSNIGLHVYASKNYVLVGGDVSDSDLKDLEKIFGTKVHKITIAGTNLVGVFLVGNDKVLLVPSIIFDSELKHLDALGINYEIFDTELTCLGNNIVVTNKGALVHTDFKPSEIEFIKEKLNIKKVEKAIIQDVEAVGNCIVIGKKQGLIHRFATSEEIKNAEKVLGVQLHLGTVNLGSPLVRTGIAANTKGFVIGKGCGGPEMVNADEALGFIE